MIRIGIAGCGRILPAHLRGFRRMQAAGVKNFRITALSARHTADAHSFVKRGAGPPQRAAISQIAGDPLAVCDEYVSDFQTGDVEVFADFRDMIASPHVDAVIDLTAHHVHHVVAEAAASHGKHLLTQKPLGATIKAARIICDLADKAGLVLGVFENWRYRPHTRHLRWLLDSGRGGDLQMVLMGNIGSWWAPALVVADTPWRHQKEVGGGICLDMGVHQFHLIRHIAGNVLNIDGRAHVVEPQRRTSSGQTIHCDADDLYFANFATALGATGHVHAGWCGHAAPVVLGGGPVFYTTAGQIAGDQFTTDQGEVFSLAELYGQHAPAATKECDFPHGLTCTFALPQLDWLSAIEGGRQAEVDGYSALEDLACAYATLESSLAGRRIAVDDVKSGAVCEYQRPLDERLGLN